MPTLSTINLLDRNAQRYHRDKYRNVSKGKMSENGRHHKKPTDREIFRDTQRILDEFFTAKLENDEDTVHSPFARSESYQAASNDNILDAQSVDSEISDEEKALARSQTMPSNYKEGENKSGTRINIKLRKENKRSGSISSGDSGDEEDEPNSSHKRRKKSLFKKAKERLIHAFHRDEKSGEEYGKISEHDTDSKKVRKEKKKNHLGKDKRKTPGESHGFLGDSSTSNRAMYTVEEEPNAESGLANGQSTLESHSSSSARKNSGGKKFFDSIKRSFRKTKKKDNVPASKSAEPISSGDKEKSYSRSVSTPDDNRNSGRGQGDRHTLPNRQGGHSRGSYDLNGNADSLHSGSKDEYEFDREDGLRQRNPEYQWMRPSLLPQTSIEVDGKDEIDRATGDPVDQKEQDEKAEVLDKIVKKLIEIGDNLESEGVISDSLQRMSFDGPGAVGGTQPQTDGEDSLTSLEREILMCLRAGGDRLSQTMGSDVGDNFVQGATQSTYEKFSQTIRHSVGDEVNWNQMALVFHATKSAYRVVGAGTKKAGQLKEMTLRFITDRWASWIMDQGGWESMISDSDSEVD